MKLATIRDGERTVAVRVEGDHAVELPAADVREVLDHDLWHDWAAGVDGPRRPLARLDYAPLVPSPDKIVCVGLNYRSHILETGREIPAHPTLFAKFRSALVGANDPIVVPFATEQVDWEAELAVVVGRRIRNANEREALDAVFGYTAANDVSARDLQFADQQWVRGKSLDTFCPVGPVIVTPDEFGDPQDKRLISRVNGETMQDSTSAEMIFGVGEILSFLSRACTLEPGDLILTGTPWGVGGFRDPPVFLKPGDTVEIEVEGIGVLANNVGGSTT